MFKINLNKTKLFIFSIILGLIFIIIAIVIANLGEKIEPTEKIMALIPSNSFLREIQKLDNLQLETYLVVYIEAGYELEPEQPDYYSCPASILGQSIKGTYHLAIFQNNTLADDIIIPSLYGTLELVYRNALYNDASSECSFDNKSQECQSLKEIKLINLNDYTGDGQPYEFLLTTTGGGCGFSDSLVIGYNLETQKIAIYSSWIPNFLPNSQGEADYLFECGNHGNQTKVERKYLFSPEKKKFEMIWEKETPCYY